MSLRSRKAPGSRRRLAAAAAVLLTAASACYSFTGGGLPGHIRTVAVLPFENNTVQPLLETDIQRELQTELPRNLGVRLAEEAIADAVVRGTVVGYEEVAASFRPSDQTSDRVPVAQRQVRITYNAEIYDLKEDRRIWSIQSQSVIGNYQPDSETPEVGRSRAIREISNRMIEGAQSQW
jgi:hypothetical protein